MDEMRLSATVDIRAIRSNITECKKRLNDGVKIFAVLKADGYGHGAIPIAKEMEKWDEVFGIAVATADEAFEMRQNNITKPILILGYTFPDSYEKIAEYEIRPAVFTAQMAKDYAAAAKKTGKKVYCHIKIDTGMHRIGYQVNEEAADEIAEIFKCKDLIPEGIFTHFARADEVDKSHAIKQKALFDQMIDYLDKRGVKFDIRHCSNSAAAMELPDMNMDAVRLGIVMYGLWPSDEMDHSFPLKPALSLYSHIVYIKELPAGCPVSYGGIYVTPSKRRIATIPVGYADGYPRSLSNKASVIIKGKPAPIVGRVCMDQMMVDITDIPDAGLLDKVTLIGNDGDVTITMEELGDISGRFNYELACDLGNRVRRIFVG
ncbi:MAG: alanine racemase [Lachnospiraceae bacterium]|nr:alanine racemase [Lachnospiraceae bacterium]